jgi:hypothetical protein
VIAGVGVNTGCGVTAGIDEFHGCGETTISAEGTRTSSARCEPS